MRNFDLKDGVQGYVDLVNAVIDFGDHVSPRGMGTRELNDVTITIADPTKAVPVGTSRKLRLSIGATETMHLIGGISSLEQLDLASANRFSQFSNDGKLRGAYGPRVKNQIPNVIKRLSDDPNSRQGIVTIFRPDDLDDGIKDVPCTVYLTFSVRDGKLRMATHMRSNDVWLGVPYDWWMFTRLQMTVAWAMKLPVGEYVHHVDSLHIYDRDIDRARTLEVTDLNAEQPPAPVSRFMKTTRRDNGSSNVIRFERASRGARATCLQHLFGSYDIHESEEAFGWYRNHVPQIDESMRLCELGCYYVLNGNEFTVKRKCDACVQHSKDTWNDRKKTTRIANAGYGRTYPQMIEDTNGRCTICQVTSGNLVIDHDHKTGKIRGLLCDRCNHALGHFRDNQTYMTRAIKYLNGEDARNHLRNDNHFIRE
jgi:thymidylate synthase